MPMALHMFPGFGFVCILNLLGSRHERYMDFIVVYYNPRSYIIYSIKYWEHRFKELSYIYIILNIGNVSSGNCYAYIYMYFTLNTWYIASRSCHTYIIYNV